MSDAKVVEAAVSWYMARTAFLKLPAGDENTRAFRKGELGEMKEIEKEFKSGELAYIDAIEALEKIGYSTREAEDIVERWEEENEFD